MVADKNKRLATARRYYHNRKKRLGDTVVYAERKVRNQTGRIRNQASWLYYEAKSRAKKRSLDFNLDKSDVVIPEFCPVLGIELKKHDGGRPWDYSPTIDRVENDKGYTKDNSRIISWRANRIKNNASLDELKAIVKYIEDHIHDKCSINSTVGEVSSAVKME